MTRFRAGRPRATYAGEVAEPGGATRGVCQGDRVTPGATGLLGLVAAGSAVRAAAKTGHQTPRRRYRPGATMRKLHKAREARKRARYAAELAHPVWRQGIHERRQGGLRTGKASSAITTTGWWPPTCSAGAQSGPVAYREASPRGVARHRRRFVRRAGCEGRQAYAMGTLSPAGRKLPVSSFAVSCSRRPGSAALSVPPGPAGTGDEQRR